MKAVFGDTAYFLALVNARDHLHLQAVAFHQQPPGPLLTTEWVLTELGDALCTAPARKRFDQLLAALRVQPDVEIVPASHELFARGCRLYADRPDKDWSLTDCISFVVMREQGVTEALTCDHHFTQAGFTVLLDEQRHE